MKIIREKRPDRVICKWKEYEVELSEKNTVWIYDGCSFTQVSLSEVPNLIKALREVST